METQSKRTLAVCRRAVLLIVLSQFTACGGGGGGGSSSQSPPSPPLIQALLFSLPPGTTPPANLANAVVSVTDSSGGTNITTASVKMNGATLTYNGAPNHEQYEGNLALLPGDVATLVVKVGDNTYTASGTQFTSYPTISVPKSGIEWQASYANAVTWSGGAPATNPNTTYFIGVLDATDPDGGAPYFQATPIATNSFSIPASTLTVGDHYLIVGITELASIPNAAVDSYFLFGGFDNAQVTVANTAITTVAGSAASFPGTGSFIDGTGSAAGFWLPGGITTDGGNLYIADTYNNAIRKMIISSEVVTTVAGSGAIGSTDGTGPAALFWHPLGITTDGTDLFVADYINSTIRQIDISTGVVTTLAGTSGLVGSTDGTGSAARFNIPGGVTTDGTNLYVADTNNNTIRQIVISTGAVTTLAGSAGLVGSTDGIGSAARFNGPLGVATDGTNLYVADTNNSTIRQIVISTGAVTTLVGSAGLAGSTDGTGSAARFNGPGGVTTDGANLYVADTNNSTIRQIVISTGAVTTLVGSAGLVGSTDGIGSAARLYSPYGITANGTSLYVTDSSNDTIRQISKN